MFQTTTGTKALLLELFGRLSGGWSGTILPIIVIRNGNHPQSGVDEHGRLLREKSTLRDNLRFSQLPIRTKGAQ